MTQDHSFPQLIQILERIHEANPGKDEGNDDDDDESDEEDDQQDRLLGLPGIRGEAPLTMLTPDILKQIQEQRQSYRPPDAKEIPDDEFTGNDQESEQDGDGDSDDYDEVFNVNRTAEESEENDKPVVSPVHRQTFIYSATLTLPFTSTKTPTTTKKSYRKQKHKTPLEGGLAEILEKTHAMGETKVVDLSSSSNNSGSQTLTSNNSHDNTKKGVQFPPGLRLEQIKCTQLHKDSHLYAYLMTTKQGASGPCLVFCNSIAAVRRVGTTLQTLGLSVRILHAHMQQVRICSTFLLYTYPCFVGLALRKKLKHLNMYITEPNEGIEVKMARQLNGSTMWACLCEQSLSHSFVPTRLLVLGDWCDSRCSFLSIVVSFLLQRARFKAVESLNKDTPNGSRAVVIATDLAARGLDIPSVSTIVHYDVARAVDTFVHRAGRTAVSIITIVRLYCLGIYFVA